MIIFVENKKIIGYISSAELTEERKQEIFSENPYAVWVNEEINYPDETKHYEMCYIDGAIEYREVKVPEPEPTELEVLQNEVTALQLALVEQYETNLALQEEITNTQMALVELYEEVM